MYNQYPYSSFAPSTYNMMQPASSNPSGIGSLLGLGRKNFSWDGFLNNAQKTLNVINQAMPIYIIKLNQCLETWEQYLEL